MDFYAADYGVKAGKNVSKELNALFAHMAEVEGEKRIIFEKGEYFLSSEYSPKPELYITNTIGEKEWKSGEKPHSNVAGMYLEGIDDLVVDGGGSVFTIDGQMTNVVVSRCSKVTLKNFTLRTLSPDMHEFKVVKKGFGYVDYALDKDSSYVNEKGKWYFTGTDYKVPFDGDKARAFWIGRVDADDPDTIRRVSHPLMGTYALRELEKGVFRAYLLFRQHMRKGDRFYIFDVRRKFAGIFVERCKDISVENIAQRFNYSLAVVCQDTENFNLSGCEFAPEKGGLLMASVADFVQICMCRGLVSINDNYFEGSGDDCLNVHGIHFPVTKREGNKITVEFAHPQSYGFNPLRAGDKIRFVNPVTLLGDKYTTVLASEAVSKKEIVLTVEDASAAEGMVVEDVSALPDLDFSRNTMNRIITRGILVTTGGKVRIADNKFLSTSMHSLLISDDAKSWYESGSVSDVTVENNYFGKCPQYNIYIKPENSVHAGYVHKNIRIRGNVFDSTGAGGIFVKSSEGVVVEGNTFKGSIRRIRTRNSSVTVTEDNN